MNNFWNEKYDTPEYLYGTEPNAYIKQELKNLKPGKILFPAEGEGRNAVYAASLGWDVTAFDPSYVARNKALKLATIKNVKIDYQLLSFSDLTFSANSFDVIVLCFSHMPPDLRKKMHNKYYSYLKPGGYLILEAFSKEQLNHNSGGPKDIDMLFSKEELQNDFQQFTTTNIDILTTNLNEGVGHQGKASIIRVFACKK